MDSKADIAYTSDIVERAAKELNLPIKDVQDIYDGIAAYVQHIARRTKHISIYFPNIGYMYLPERAIVKRLKALKLKEKRGTITVKEKKELSDYFKKYQRWSEFLKIRRDLLVEKKKGQKKPTYHRMLPPSRHWFYTSYKELESLEDFAKELARKK